MNGKRISPAHLNELRQQAVRMRLEQRTLKEISARTGLSRPTIIAAYKSFVAGGWAAVDTGKRGAPGGSKAAPGLADEEGLIHDLIRTCPEESPAASALWSLEALSQWLETRIGQTLRPRTLARYAARWGLTPEVEASEADAMQRWAREHYPEALARAGSRRGKLLIGGITDIKPVGAVSRGHIIFARDQRGKLFWLAQPEAINAAGILDFFERLTRTLEAELILLFKSPELDGYPDIRQWLEENRQRLTLITIPPLADRSSPEAVCREPSANQKEPSANPKEPSANQKEPSTEQAAPPFSQTRPVATQTRSRTLLRNAMTLTHLQRLEAESIQIMREVVAETENPVMLYSVGKDSAVMLHLAVKAFSPSVPPFPLLHVDTTWKFQAMYEFRDQMVKDLGMKLIVHTNPEGLAQNINPFTHGSALHTDIMKTEALKQALDKHGFDAAFGGARRDEEKSRAKERIFSFRTAQHRWDPKSQRPELWKLYNTRKHPKESIRVFPLSNWTELDIWQYIHLEQIPIVPLYYAAERPVVERDGALIMVDDKRMPLNEGEVPMMKKVRFRTLGCYPLTGAVESEADTLPAIIQEMLLTNSSERQGRVIDHDSSASMEKKKQEGYF